jgi:putative transposase
MNNFPPLLPGQMYHIYNRGNNRENIFVEPDNYRFFLERYFQFANKFAETYAYCLLRNHFHLLIGIKENINNEGKPLRSLERPYAEHDLKGFKSDEQGEFASLQLSNFFNSYSKSFNKMYSRSGSLFTKPFRRKLIENDSYFTQVIAYIHLNSERHGFVNDFREYPYSSYHDILSEVDTKVQRESVLNWFGGKEAFKTFHLDYRKSRFNEAIIVED